MRVPNGQFTALTQHVFYHPCVSECTHLKPLLDSKLPVEPIPMQTTARAETLTQIWDRQLEEDLEAGRLDALLAEVDKEYAAGLGQPL